MTGIKARLYSLALAGALTLAGLTSLVLAGSAQAGVSTSPVYTSTTLENGNSVAGYSAFSASEVNFTHIESFIGSSGDSSWENLPVASTLAGQPVGTTMTGLSGDVFTPGAGYDPIRGGAGLQLCDRNVGGSGNLGEAAQLGLVNVGGGSFDVVEALGAFNPTSKVNAALNSSGNVCDNGVLGAAPGSVALVVKVLLTGIRANDTVQAGILYDPRSHYTFHGGIVQQGYITFYATDLSNLGLTNQDFLGGGVYFQQDVTVMEHTYHFNPLLTNEADAGVVSDTTLSPSISGTPVPAPNGGSLEWNAPNELVRFAHTKASANSTVIGGHETAGAGAFYNVGAWTAYPVASTSDGTPAGMLKLDPQQFAADNFAVEGGLGLI